MTQSSVEFQLFWIVNIKTQRKIRYFWSEKFWFAMEINRRVIATFFFVNVVLDICLVAKEFHRLDGKINKLKLQKEKLARDLEMQIQTSKDHQQTLLKLAIQSENFEVVKFLIQNGAEINAKVKDEMTPLHLAIATHNVKIVELLVKNGADVNAVKELQMTPLHALCTLYYNFKIAVLLLQNGADTKAKAGHTDDTPLHCAARNGNLEFVEILLKYGARKDLKNKFNQLPWQVAEEVNGPPDLWENRKKVIQLLK